MNLTGIVGRAVYAVLVAVVAFVVLLIVGLLVSKFGAPDIGSVIQKYAALIALLVGLAQFFTGFAHRVN